MEMLRQEEEEVRRKLDEMHVLPEADARNDWEKRYDEVQAEKAAQEARDRDAELRMRERREEKETKRSSNRLAIYIVSSFR